MPVLCEDASPRSRRIGRNVKDTAERKAMPHIASRPFLRPQVAVVLWDRSLVHRRAEVRRISQCLRESVVGQYAESVGILSSHIHVSSVVPALGGILEPIDRAHGKSLTLNNRVWIAAGSQYSSINKRQRLVRPPRTNRPRSRWRVVDQMRPLQMKSARAEITHSQRSVAAKALLQLRVPLLHVLRRRVWVERSEAHGSRLQIAVSQHRRAEIESAGEQRRRRREIVGLLRLRKHIGNIVALVAPRVHVHRRKKDSVSSPQH